MDIYRRTFRCTVTYTHSFFPVAAGENVVRIETKYIRSSYLELSSGTIYLVHLSIVVQCSRHSWLRSVHEYRHFFEGQLFGVQGLEATILDVGSRFSVS